MTTRSKINENTIKLSYQSGATVLIENLASGEIKYTYPNGVYAIEWFLKEGDNSFFIVTWYSSEGVRLSEDSFSAWGQDSYDLGTEEVIESVLSRY